MKVCVVGAGYVGLSLAVLLSQKYEVIAYDINKNIIKKINKKKSPFIDKDLQNFLLNKNLKLSASDDKNRAYESANYIIICTPTNYDESKNKFDTSSVEQAIEDTIKINPKAIIVIKSTIPIGFTKKMRDRYNKKDIFFSPEFLRESKALHDNLFPSRIVVGDQSVEAEKFANMLIECSSKKKSQVKILKMDSKSAESVKLFSNTYLAMRISFFNELDSFCEFHQIDTKDVIEGVCLDPRIGNYYNNPSFGYGGYCLPKDTKQLLQNFHKVPNDTVKAVVKSNNTRKNFIFNSIMNKSYKKIGIYRLVMKDGSDNFKESAILDILKLLSKKNVQVIIYEPLIKEDYFDGIQIENDFSKFEKQSEIIIANRVSKRLKSVLKKVYTRDIFNVD